MVHLSLFIFFLDRLPELWVRTGEHLMLTGSSISLAMLFGFPLGILAFRISWLKNPVMGAIGVFQTIPSLAMLAFLLTLLQKIGALPAIIALTLYALLPIVRNTLAGLEGVPENIMEAARGIGMTEFQQFKLVRIPLAAPVMVAGIRTAAVVCVGVATLSAFIGAGGLGQFINRGLALSDTRLILLGAIPAALLALAVDFSIGAFVWALEPERKMGRNGSTKALMRSAAFFMPLILILAGILSFFTQPFLERPEQGAAAVHTKTIRIGTKNYTEQIILGEIMAHLIETKTDLVVDRRFNLGGTMICHGALVSGEIDLYAEYTGTALTAILKEPLLSAPGAAFEYVAKAYLERYGLKWIEPFGFNNTYAITVRGVDAKKHGWKRISDLKTAASNLSAGFTSEFAERPDGYPGLSKAYGLVFGKALDVDPSLMYPAIYNGEVDVICAFSTDGRIAAYNLKPLADNRKFFPPYYAAPVVNQELLQNYPELDSVLSLVAGLINNDDMQRMNFKVDGEGQGPADVAKTFLRSKNL